MPLSSNSEGTLPTVENCDLMNSALPAPDPNRNTLLPLDERIHLHQFEWDHQVAVIVQALLQRRRNRMNGVVSQIDEATIRIDVVQSYGNCPQYIQTRRMEFIRDPLEQTVPISEQFSELDQSPIDQVRRSDTFFVASHNDQDDKFNDGGADVNHRGGRLGFVKVEGNSLTIPDYIGNFAFKTLGNFQVTPKAELLFLDFDSGDLLQLTGTVEVLWDKNDEISAFRGAFSFIMGCD